MAEYLTLGLIECADCADPTYYFPHNSVLKSNGTTITLRTIFDGSAVKLSGMYLNFIIMEGPRLKPDYRSILLR